MVILLTGASGLLGSHILNEGLKKGFKFKTVSRSISKRSFLSKVTSQVTHTELDLVKEDIPDSLLKDVDIIINCAALASPSQDDAGLMNKINVHAAQKLYMKAEKYKVKHWVQISSISTMDNGSSDQLITEKSHGLFRKTSYAASKYEIDQWLSEQKKIPVSTIHPCYMLGAFDSRPSSGAIIFALKLGKINNLFDNEKNFVAASDVAKAVLKCIEKKYFERYIVGGHNISLDQFSKKVTDTLKVENNIIFYKKEENISLLPQREIEFMKEFSMSSPVSFRKAQKDLSYTPELTVDDMLRETINYFIEKKLLRIKRSIKC